MPQKFESTQRFRKAFQRYIEKIRDAIDEVETGDNQHIIMDIIADNFAQCVQVRWLEPGRNFKVLFDQRYQFTLQGRDVGGQAADQIGYPAGLSSCSLQECFVAVDSVMTVVEARNRCRSQLA